MNVLHRLSIRARITVGSLLIGAVVLSGVAVALHVEIEAATAATDRSLAASDAAPFVSDLRNNPDEVPDRPAEDVLVGIRDSSGAWVLDTLPPDVRRALPEGVPDGEVTLRLHHHDRVATAVGIPVSTDRGDAVVWAAHDGRAGRQTLELVDRSLVGGTAVALLAFAAAAWLLSTIALRPVGQMRATAERISSGSADEHLPVGPPDDELAALARTLNTFIDRQRENAARERQMVSDASHELRTPLAALTARLELAHRDSGDAAALERALTAAEGDAARLAALADTLLELSRLDDVGPDAGTGARATAAELVTELMASVDRARTLGDGARTLADGAWDIDFDADVAVPDARYALDPAAFARIVDNLIANAIAAGTDDGSGPSALGAGTPGTVGGGVIRLSLAQDPDQRLHLRVVDDGPGVPPSFLPHAFERFTRADPARRVVLGGSGLGLALVRGIAERAGGSAWLENGATGGAVAGVDLPVA